MEYSSEQQRGNEHKKGKDFPESGSYRPRRPILGGLIILVIGIGLLIRQIPGFNEYFPTWIFDWPMIFIVIGLYLCFRDKSFFGGGIFLVLGIFFLLNDQNILGLNLQRYLFPLFIIFLGVTFIIRRRRGGSRQERFWERREFHRNRRHGFTDHPFPAGVEDPGSKPDEKETKNQSDQSDNDFVSINSIFGSSVQNVYSKSFKGGNITCLFGGGKVDLVRADIRGLAILNLSVDFGGVEIQMPANWKVKNELAVIFGGIEDKRASYPNIGEAEKTLILRGHVFCGGIELRS